MNFYCRQLCRICSAKIPLVSCVKIYSKYHLFQPIRCLFRPLKMPKYDNLRPLITPKRLHLISGAWKSLKGTISGPWKCQKSFISGPWKLQKGFSWFQGPEKAKKVSFQAPETAKMCERFFMHPPHTNFSTTSRHARKLKFGRDPH